MRREAEIRLNFGHDSFPGGGFAMAAASQKSGLSEMLGEQLIGLQELPPIAILTVVCLSTTFVTEVSSNTAIANIVLPVLAKLVSPAPVRDSWVRPSRFCLVSVRSDRSKSPVPDATDDSVLFLRVHAACRDSAERDRHGHVEHALPRHGKPEHPLLTPSPPRSSENTLTHAQISCRSKPDSAWTWCASSASSSVSSPSAQESITFKCPQTPGSLQTWPSPKTAKDPKTHKIH